MLVKICGIMRSEDAAAAVDLGAGALGFVFWPRSPRCIDPFRAREIVASLPPFVTAVGVFVNQPAEYVNSVAALVGLGAVQLHGDETLAFAKGIRRPVIKAIGVGSAAHGDLVGEWSEHMVLLDAHDPGQRGGTGQTIDWTLAARVAATHRLLLAGGLTSENVGDAIRRVQPFGIDVSSGVEERPGIKSHQKLQDLFHAIHDYATRS